MAFRYDSGTSKLTLGVGDGEVSWDRLDSNVISTDDLLRVATWSGSDPDVMNGSVYYNTSLTRFRYCENGMWVSYVTREEGVSSTRERITQSNHGLSVGNCIRYNGTSWVKSQADTAANSEVYGIVESVPDANTFIVVYAGKITLSGLTEGTTYFLSASTAGLLTPTPPTGALKVRKPVLHSIGTSSAIVNVQLGIEMTGG